MLPSGTRLGAYEIVGLLGAGGMGEVYRARDPRLGREVAIKVLPTAFAADPERLRRFEQEARAAAALNHPNILAVHDFGQHDGAPFIVSELLEGEALRERVQEGALPVRKAIEYAAQIAQGLAAAHEKGIVHRDLKPENLFITADGRVKILDFGLAKLTQEEPALAGLSVLPTAAPDTLPGTVLGTIGYMAPEQVRGHVADHRSDIFALGTILHEMLSGQRAFRGDTPIDTMTAILKEDAPALPVAERHIPPALGRIVDRCLEKNPAARFQSTRDLAFALEGVSGHADTASTIDTEGNRSRFSRTAAIATSVAVLIIIAAVSFGAWNSRRIAPGAARPYRSSLLPPPDATLGGSVALSPDGARLAFVARSADGQLRLWVRPLDGLAAYTLPGTEGAGQPFWSPDSRSIGFIAGTSLKRVDAGGGAPVTLCPIPGGNGGGTWSQDDVIVFVTDMPGTNNGALWRVSGSGGMCSIFMRPDEKNGEVEYLRPAFLPDGVHFLYIALGIEGSRGLWVGTLDSTDRRLVLPAGSSAMYAQGQLLHMRGTTLVSQAFDATALVLQGEATPLAENVATTNIGGSGNFSVSQTGVLAYQSPAATTSQLEWFDRSGRPLGSFAAPGDYGSVELSPDGSRVAVDMRDESTRTYDLWVIDVARGLATRFTFDPGDDTHPVWSPDNSRIVFRSRRAGTGDLYVKAANGLREEKLLDDDASEEVPLNWSSDGELILYAKGAGNAPKDLWLMPVSGSRQPKRLVETPFTEGAGRFSPDGRWMAFPSNKSGKFEVYVISTDGAGSETRVSSNGGFLPRWRRDGLELFFLASENGAGVFPAADTVMAAEIKSNGGTLEVGAVRPLFKVRPRMANVSGINFYPYEVFDNGQRFLINTAGVADASPRQILLVGWPALLPQ